MICKCCKKEIDESLFATSNICERCFEFIQEANEQYKDDIEEEP